MNTKQADPNVTPLPTPPAEAKPEEVVLPIDEVPSLAFTLVAEPEEPEPAPAPPRKRRGFACVDRAILREIARRGGAAAAASGKGHRFTTEEAREAGRKGGRAAHRTRGTAAAAAAPAPAAPAK